MAPSEVLDAPRCKPVPSGASARRFDRLPVLPSVPALFAAPPDAGYRDGFVDEASANGLSLLTTFPLESGEALSITLRHAGPASARTLLARVRHVTPSGGGWLVGCELDRPLTEVELRYLRG